MPRLVPRRDAQDRLQNNKPLAQQIAQRGAYSRSVEQFIQSGDWSRAWEELQQWQESFPADKIDGYREGTTHPSAAFRLSVVSVPSFQTNPAGYS